MKNPLLLTLSLIFCLVLNAQNDVYFKISHKINKQPFSTSTSGTNNLGDEFTITRLQYYISNIRIIHNGGQEIMVDSTWILANAKTTTDVLLGNFTITNLEGIKFSIGVEDSINHLDPALYDMSHPLAPKSPSMHWGWSAGYRFLAMEGYSDGQNYQLHGLGDDNYFEKFVSTSGEIEDTNIIIHIEGNYEYGIKDIAVSGGVVSHGETGDAKLALENFRDSVFDVYKEDTIIEDSIASSISKIKEKNVKIYPTFLNNGEKLNVKSKNVTGLIKIQDITGAILREERFNKEAHLDVADLQIGLYIISVSDIITGDIYIERIIKK